MELPQPNTGSGFPSFRWTNVGDVIAGEITNEPRQLSTKAIDPGKPDVDNLVFELHTDAPISCKTQKGEVLEGQDWAIWIPIHSQRYTAVYEAVVPSGGKLTKGAKIAIKLAALEDVGKPSLMKVFEVGFKPGAAAPSAAPSVDDLLG
jgi:hypothetical protein